MRKFLIAAFATATLLFTTACAQLPHDGQVLVGPNIEAGLETDYLYYSPSGPVENATQEQILQGFINAGTGPQNDYSIARSFLSSEFAAKWDPNARVVVQSSKPQITMSESNSATVVVPLVASIDERGQFEVAKQGSTESFGFEFVKEGEQWRISKAPNLTMVIRPVFDVIFKAYSIYFYDNQSKYLVPDVRWFPSRASTSTRLISAMLKGPSDWLANTVHSEIPEGTSLNLNTVTVAEGIASVDLSKKALTASVHQKRLMQAQISKSLMQLPSVYSVRVSIERGVLDSFTLPSDFDRVMTPVGLIDNNLVHIDSGSQTPVPEANTAIGDRTATEFGLRADEKLLAYNTPSGTYLSYLGVLGEQPKLLSSRNDFLAPIIDKQGFTWLIAQNGGGILVFDANGKRINFDSRWLTGSKVTAFAISGEGSRIAAIVGDGKNTKLWVSGIVRDESGVPIYFDQPISPNSGAALFSVTWLDETRLGLLEEQTTNYSQPLITMVGGASTALPNISGAKSIIGAGQSSTIYLLDIYRAMHIYRGSNWMRVASDIDALH